jgi:hypothetical protein
MDTAKAALDLAEEAIASHDASSMRRALLALKRARGELRFARMTAMPNEGNTSPARLEALDERLRLEIERLAQETT